MGEASANDDPWTISRYDRQQPRRFLYFFANSDVACENLKLKLVEKMKPNNFVKNTFRHTNYQNYLPMIVNTNLFSVNCKHAAGTMLPILLVQIRKYLFQGASIQRRLPPTEQQKANLRERFGSGFDTVWGNGREDGTCHPQEPLFRFISKDLSQLNVLSLFLGRTS